MPSQKIVDNYISNVKNAKPIFKGNKEKAHFKPGNLIQEMPVYSGRIGEIFLIVSSYKVEDENYPKNEIYSRIGHKILSVKNLEYYWLSENKNVLTRYKIL